MDDERELPTIDDLDELAAELDAAHPGDLYVRWSKGPAADLAHGGAQSSRDDLTGVRLPGLSANPLRVERWWHDRPIDVWLARRLYDYQHLSDQRGPEVRPWVLVGQENGRGPDNEPLVRCLRPVAWISDDLLKEAQRIVEAQNSDVWGPLDRRGGG
jgi:hypothetical protein